MTTAKLDQIGEQQPEKEAHAPSCTSLDEERQRRAVSVQLAPLDARNWLMIRTSSLRLEIVGRAGKQHAARQRPAMQMRADLRSSRQ